MAFPHAPARRSAFESFIAGPLLAGAVLLSGCVAYPPPPPQVAPPPPVAPPPVVALPPPVMPAPPAPAPMAFYPEREQTAELLDRDRYACYLWASRESGSDPGMNAVATPALPLPPEPPPAVIRSGGEVLAGAATGALMGAAVSMPRYAGENAAIGAILGAAFAALAQESRAQAIERSQAQAQARAQAQYAHAVARAARPADDGFRRAMTACMNARGYRVG